MKHVRVRDPPGSVRHGEWTDAGVISADQSYDPHWVDILAPTEFSKIVCIELNYAAEIDSDIPEQPLLFLNGPNAVSGHGDTITLLPDEERIDHETEVGVSIGEQCRNALEDEATDVIWAAVGPVIATTDEGPDDPTVELRFNSEVKQRSSKDDLLFPIPELVAEITRYLTLERGDVIAMGTTSVISPHTGGDTVEVEVKGVGTLTNDIRGPTARGSSLAGDNENHFEMGG